MAAVLPSPCQALGWHSQVTSGDTSQEERRRRGGGGHGLRELTLRTGGRGLRSRTGAAPCAGLLPALRLGLSFRTEGAPLCSDQQPPNALSHPRCCGPSPGQVGGLPLLPAWKHLMKVVLILKPPTNQPQRSDTVQSGRECPRGVGLLGDTGNPGLGALCPRGQSCSLARGKALGTGGSGAA